MKKNVIVSLCSMLFFALAGFSQNASLGQQVTTDLETKSKTERGKYQLTENKTDNIEVTGISNSIFSTSNTYNGSAESFRHSVRINVQLQTTAKTGTFELVFYSVGEVLPYSAGTIGNNTIVYYPIELYDNIKQKLEQSLASKKKIQLKIVQMMNGFREGTLVF